MRQCYFFILIVATISLFAGEENCPNYTIQTSCEMNSKCKWDEVFGKCKLKEGESSKINDKPVIPPVPTSFEEPSVKENLPIQKPLPKKKRPNKISSKKIIKKE